MYAIVEFISDGTCEMAPKKWLRGENVCLWPPAATKSFEIATYIKRLQIPDEDWEAHRVTVLGEAASYKDARKKAKKAQSQSDLTTDPEDYGRGKRRKKNRHLHSSSDESPEVKKKRPAQRCETSDDSDDDSFGASKKIIESLPPAPPPLQSSLNRDSLHSTPLHRSQAELTFSPRSRSSDIINSPLEKTPNTHSVLKLVLQELSVIRHTQKRQMEVAEAILQRVTLNESILPIMQTQEVKLKQEFPLRNEEDVQALEIAITDVHCEKEFVTKLKTIGGNTYGDTTRRILKFLLTEDAAVIYSWTGSRERKSFSSLNISKIIVDVVVKASEATVTRSQVEEIIKNWLRHAKERKAYKSKI